MPVDVDVIIGRDAADPPFGIFVWLGRERLQRRAIELQEQIAAADAQAAHRPGVEIGDQFGDRLVQLAEREEAAVPEARQNPAFDDQHTDFNPRFREGRLFGLSGTSCAGAPPMKASARTCAPIQSGSVWVQLASA
jgi:hypothetical protein